jgi:hypothetical protein
MELLAMQLAAIVKARTLAFIEIDELNRRGNVRLADIVPAIVKRYDFMSYPAKIEDFDMKDKGVTFASGRLADIVIDTVVVYSTVIYVETLSSTEDSRKVLLDILEWGAKELNFTYRHGMISRWAYVSHITFFTDFPLMRTLSSPLNDLAQKTSEQVSEFFGEDIAYQPMTITVGHDPRLRQHAIAPFSIQQRANVRFEANKYFSESPLPTDVHIRFLEDFVADLGRSNQQRS